MIPKLIHYCWFGGTKKNSLTKRCIESWRQYLPDYYIKEWNERNSPLDHPFVKEAYAQRRWSKVANYVRLHALFSEGGIYFDTDVEVVKSFNSLLDNKCFLGFQQIEEGKDWVNNAVIGSEPGHHFIKQCLDLTVDSYFKEGIFYVSPEITTRILRTWGLKIYGGQKVKDVTLYPREYFYPYSWKEKFSSSFIVETTHAVHHWDMSWVSPFERVKSNIKKYLFSWLSGN